MEQNKLQTLKSRLLQEQARLASRQESSDQAGTVELDQSRVGRLSRMDALQNQQIALETKRRNERRLAAIAGALKRIASDDFGYCFVCGDEIPYERLHLDPAVTRCVSCSQQG